MADLVRPPRQAAVATAQRSKPARSKPAMHKVPRRRSKFKMRVRSTEYSPAKHESALEMSVDLSPDANVRKVDAEPTVIAGNDSDDICRSTNPSKPTTSPSKTNYKPTTVQFDTAAEPLPSRTLRSDTNLLPWPPPAPPSGSAPLPPAPQSATTIPPSRLPSEHNHNTLPLDPAERAHQTHIGISLLVQQAEQNQSTKRASQKEQKEQQSDDVVTGPLDQLASVLAVLQRPAPAIIPLEESPQAIILPRPTVNLFQPTPIDQAPSQLLDATTGLGTPLSRDQLPASNYHVVKNASLSGPKPHKMFRRKFIDFLPIYGSKAIVESARRNMAKLQGNVGILVRGVNVHVGYLQASAPALEDPVSSYFRISLTLNSGLDALIWHRVTRQGAIWYANPVSSGKIRLTEVVSVRAGENFSGTDFLLEVSERVHVGRTAAASQSETRTHDIAFLARTQDERNRVVVAIHTLLRLFSFVS